MSARNLHSTCGAVYTCNSIARTSSETSYHAVRAAVQHLLRGDVVVTDVEHAIHSPTGNASGMYLVSLPAQAVKLQARVCADRQLLCSLEQTVPTSKTTASGA